MIDIVLVFFGGVAVGAIVEYIYEKKREWKLDEIVEVLDKIKDNEHFKRHVKEALKGRDDEFSKAIIKILS